jgi:hypothetical protein
MHGLIFETSVWLLAESTRLISLTFSSTVFQNSFIVIRRYYLPIANTTKEVILWNDTTKESQKVLYRQVETQSFQVALIQHTIHRKSKWIWHADCVWLDTFAIKSNGTPNTHQQASKYRSFSTNRHTYAYLNKLKELWVPKSISSSSLTYIVHRTHGIRIVRDVRRIKPSWNQIDPFPVQQNEESTIPTPHLMKWTNWTTRHSELYKSIHHYWCASRIN